LARYDYAKMNLTSAIKLKQVEKEIEENQNSLTKWIDDYDYKVRRLENFVSILDNTRNQNITKLKQEIKLI
ncbi:TPA: helical hairpin domain-containing protein, partial [Streptococcus suis]